MANNINFNKRIIDTLWVSMEIIDKSIVFNIDMLYFMLEEWLQFEFDHGLLACDFGLLPPMCMVSNLTSSLLL